MNRGAAILTVTALLGALILPLGPTSTLLGADDPVPASVEALRRQVDGILDQGRYRRSSWGLIAVSLDRGDTLLARNPELPLIPASNLKVVTSAAALHHLGDDFRFLTYVVSDAPVVDGVVQGNLILFGTGDPGISDRFHANRYVPFRALADELWEAGIREVRGRVMGDGSFLSGPLLGEGWEAGDLNEWFAAPSGALSFNENVFSMRVRGGPVSRRPEILTIPEHLGVLVANEALTVSGRGRQPIWLLRESPEDPIRVVGEIGAGSRDVWRQMTVRDPALAAAHAFTHILRESGIAVAGYPGSLTEVENSPLTSRGVWRAGQSMRVLATFRSPTLGEYLRAVNQRSHNLYADLILKTLGRTAGPGGSFDGGSQVVRSYLTEVVGIPEDQVEIRDGSGLSTLNRISAGGLLATVRHLAGTPEWDSFWESLPVAGTSLLHRRMARTAAAGNLRAKTGTVNRVSALTGMVRSMDGERIVFSIVGNDLPSEAGAKRLEDQVGRMLAEWRR